MAMDFKLVSADTYNQLFSSKVVATRNALVANPSSTVAELAIILTDTERNTQDVMDVMEVLGLAKMITGVRGEVETSVYWHVTSFADAVEADLLNANTWVDNNPNGLMSEMQISLGLEYEIAMAIVKAQEQSLKIKRVRE